MRNTVYTMAARRIGKTYAKHTFILDSLGSEFEERPLTETETPLDKNGKPLKSLNLNSTHKL
jgi:hypothetical protein